MLELDVITNLITLVIHGVVNWENMFGSKSGEEKKKEVWNETLSKLYDVADAWADFSPFIEIWVKDELIPDIIDSSVLLFNEQGHFTLDTIDEIINILVNSYTQKGYVKSI